MRKTRQPAEVAKQSSSEESLPKRAPTQAGRKRVRSIQLFQLPCIIDTLYLQPCCDLKGKDAAAPTMSSSRHSKPANQPLATSKHPQSSRQSDPMTPAKSQDGCKARKKHRKKSKNADRHLRQFTQSVTVDGNTFSGGDSVYIMMTNSFDVDEFADVEVCQVCGQTEPEDVPILECNKCLQGYHLTCLTPPLEEVPKVCSAASLPNPAHFCHGPSNLLQGVCPLVNVRAWTGYNPCCPMSSM